MKILITGGAGFIGSAVIRHIIKDTNDSVVNVDKLTYAGNLENLLEVSHSERYKFDQVDICNFAELERVFAEHQPDAIMHLAAESHVDRSIDSPSAFIETNIVGTYTLLEVARQYWQSLESRKKTNFRFHHISTDEVYGDLPHPSEQPGAEEHLFTEKTAYSPSSPYSASKAGSDHLVRAWYRTYGFPVLITNCSNNYGPYHFPEKLIPLIVLNALEEKSLPIYGKGDQIRDWLYVEDHARALYKVITEGKVGETYNIGGHNEKQNIDVVKTICKALDELVPLHDRHSDKLGDIANSANDAMQNNAVIAKSDGHGAISSYSDLITFVKDRPGHDRRYAIDASKIQKELGWEPQETFESGIRKTVKWYLNNREWSQRIQDGRYQRERLGVSL